MKNINNTPQVVKFIEVIYVKTTRGAGTNDDSVRFVHQYWDKEGNLLAEHDDY